MATTTEDKIKELKAEERKLEKELDKLAFVTDNESGYVKFHFTNDIDMDLDYQEWEKEFEKLCDGVVEMTVGTRVEVIGDSFGGIDLNRNDLDKISVAQYEARKIARNIAHIRRQKAQQRKIKNKEQEVERMKNQNEPKEEGFIGLTVFADEYWNL